MNLNLNLVLTLPLALPAQHNHKVTPLSSKYDVRGSKILGKVRARVRARISARVRARVKVGGAASKTPTHAFLYFWPS